MDNWTYFYFSALRVLVAFVMAKAIADAITDRRSNWIDYALAALGVAYLGAVLADSLNRHWFDGLDQLFTRPTIALFLTISYYGLHLERDRLRNLSNPRKEKHKRAT